MLFAAAQLQCYGIGEELCGLFFRDAADGGDRDDDFGDVPKDYKIKRISRQ